MAQLAFVLGVHVICGKALAANTATASPITIPTSSENQPAVEETVCLNLLHGLKIKREELGCHWEIFSLIECNLEIGDDTVGGVKPYIRQHPGTEEIT